MLSSCVYLGYTLRLTRPYCSQSAQRAFTLHSPFVERSPILQSDFIIFRLITMHTFCVFVIFPRLPTKHNVRITPKELRINHSSCVHILLPCVYLSLCARDRSPFTFHKCSSISIQPAFIFSSLCTHRSLSVRSPFSRR